MSDTGAHLGTLGDVSSRRSTQSTKAASSFERARTANRANQTGTMAASELPWAQPCIAAGEYAGVCFDRLFAAGLEGSVPRDDANFTQLLPVQALRKDRSLAPSDGAWDEARGMCSSMDGEHAQRGCVYGLARVLFGGFEPSSRSRWQKLQPGSPTPIAPIVGMCQRLGAFRSCVAGCALSQAQRSVPTELEPHHRSRVPPTSKLRGDPQTRRARSSRWQPLPSALQPGHSACQRCSSASAQRPTQS